MPEAHHICPSCRRTFKRKPHLRRHVITSHHSAQHHPCLFCSRVFSRSDAARRHARSCAGRLAANEPLPPPLSKTRSRRVVCIPCARSKARCDRAEPCCRRCAGLGLQCVYYHHGGVGRGEEKGAQGAGEGDTGESSETPLSFLLDSSDPATALPLFVEEKKSAAASQGGDPPRYEPPPPPGVLHWWPWFGDEALVDPQDLLSSSTECVSLLPDPPVSAREVIEQLIWRLSSATSEFADMDSSVDRATAAALAEGVRQHVPADFITIYFRTTHWPCPLVHRASFDAAETTSLLLVLAVGLTAAALTQSKQQQQQQQQPCPSSLGASLSMCIEIAAELIFCKLESLSMTDHRAGEGSGCSWSTEKHPTRAELEICQAAVLVSGLLVRDDREPVRRRLMTRHFPCLVATARSLGLFAGPRPRTPHTPPSPSPGWQRWVMAESASRLATWIYCGAAVLTVYFGQPPPLLLSEFRVRLPAYGDDDDDDALWLARSAHEFEAGYDAATQAQASTCSRSPVSLAQLMEAFLRNGSSDDGQGDDEDDDGDPGRDPKPTVLGLYLVLWGLHLVIFQLQTSMLPTSSVGTVVRAFERWTRAWTSLRTAASSAEMAGIMRFAPQFAWLASKMLQCSLGDQGLRGHQGRTPQYTTAWIHFLIQAKSLCGNFGDLHGREPGVVVDAPAAVRT